MTRWMLVVKGVNLQIAVRPHEQTRSAVHALQAHLTTFQNVCRRELTVKIKDDYIAAGYTALECEVAWRTNGAYWLCHSDLVAAGAV